ncbi:MAG TPA: right-handed parallel beta-helix repeat-containing protein [Lacipirellulaceae bacterium]|nr:right-handed parallel beta-helix repeat-containing protein [Lacipirellulaceae bacterium]
MKKLLLFCLATSFLAATASAREWFVRHADAGASESGDGSADHPLRTINAAAQLAQPGDVVTVGAGTYHEWVSPARGGTEKAPIVYRSVPEHAAIVRGTDVLEAQWQAVPDAPGVFTAPLPQKSFIFGNPFIRPPGSAKNKPEWVSRCDALVFVDDRPLDQVTGRERLIETPGSWLSSHDGGRLLVHLRGNTVPAPGAIEITTRDRIFAPHRRGLGYIRVEGFVFERCATRPDWPQLGALSTRTGHHWTIRNNIVRDTTGKGIDCGSETWSPELLIDTEPQDKRVLIGGHHLVEGNLVTNNAQCGIAAWNTESVSIVGNIVRENCARGAEKPIHFLADAEAAGIKVHAFRHGLIEGNLVIGNLSFGIWLDNGWENARVTRNVSVGNRGAGIFVELGFGPILVDHNLSAANTRLWPPYLGDGIYTHDASNLTIVHNTLLDNAHYGLQELVVSERSYANRRLAEASNEMISGNLFVGNKDAAISLPLDTSRSRYNHSDYNAIESGASFVINNNESRIPTPVILKSCREQLEAAHVPSDQRPDTLDPKRLPMLSLPAWRVVMQMDQNSTILPANLHIHFDKDQKQFQIDLPTSNAIPTVPAGPGDDFDLLGQHVKHGGARVGAISGLHKGKQVIRVWPLVSVDRPEVTAP